LNLTISLCPYVSIDHQFLIQNTHSLIPVDFQTEGHIVDDDIINMLVKPMPKGVTVTVLMDCCHSGTVLDLPYKISADDTDFTREENFDMDIVSEPTRSGRGAVSYAPTRRKKEKKVETSTSSPKGKNRDLAPDAPVGPKLAPNGLPVLPIRKAMKVDDIKGDESENNNDDDDDNNDDDDDEDEDSESNDNEGKGRPSKEQAMPINQNSKKGNAPPTQEKKKRRWRLFGKKK
jgi:Caspase domain